MNGSPRVGFFWYDPVEDELFGVVSVDATDQIVERVNTVDVIHDEWWYEEKKRLIATGLPLGRFSGSHDDYPRGRVFKFHDGFVLKVRDRVPDRVFDALVEKVVDEFHLEGVLKRVKGHFEE